MAKKTFTTGELFKKYSSSVLSIDFGGVGILQENLDKAKRVQAVVGIDGRKRKLQMIAIAQEYGTVRAGKQHIPPRSFLRASYNKSWKYIRNEAIVKPLMKTSLKYNKELAFSYIEGLFRDGGEQFRDVIWQRVARKIRPALKKATVKQKKAKGYAFPRTPLIGRGDLMDALEVKIKRLKK